MSEIQAPEFPQPKYRVLVAVPAGDHVTTGFAHDLAQMCGQTTYNNPEIEIRLVFNKGTLLPSQRTGLVYDALRQGSTHILFLDSDMRFPAWTIRDLLAHGVPVVGVNYATRRFPIKPTAFLSVERDERLYTEPGQTDLTPVEAIGFGAVLIDLDVFRYLPQPWFNVEWVEVGDGDRRSGFYRGEDLYFCDKVRKAEIPVLVDQGLSAHIRHEGSWEYSHDHALVQRGEVHAAEAQRGNHELRDTEDQHRELAGA